MGTAVLGGLFGPATTPHPGGVTFSESLKGCALVSGSGTRVAAGRLEEAAGR